MLLEHEITFIGFINVEQFWAWLHL